MSATETDTPGTAAPGADAGEACSLDLRIGGMDCPDCARRIRDRLRATEGVLEAEGNPVSRRLRVTYDGARIAPDRIREEIGRLGYAAEEETADASGPRRAATLAGEAWTGPTAIRAYVSAGLFAAALLLRLLGLEPLLVALPFHDLHLPDLVLLASAAVGGWNFFPKGVRAARALSLDMNFLMTIAILGAVAIGEFPEAAAIAFLFSFAELLEEFAVDRARRSIESLMALAPDAAVVVRDGAEVTVPASEVRRGDLLVVRAGERIAADGTVEEGSSAVNEATITGESVPAEKGEGDAVFAGTVAEEGYLRVRVEKAGGDTAFARILRLVEEAEGRKAPTERFVERFARWYTPAVTVLAVLVAAAPPLLFGAGFETWFLRGLTLLVIACPCALVISTPVAVVSGITAAARHGVLLKGGVHLEAMGGVRVVALDKTGTLTRGHVEVTDVVPLDGASEREVLALAATLERRSEHPLAKAIVRAAEERGATETDGSGVEEFEIVRGMGARGRAGGRELRVGRPELFDLDGDLPEPVHALRRRGRTAVLVGAPGAPVGVIALADRPRDEAAEAIRALREAGIERVVMLTGDDPETAAAVAAEIGVDEVHAGLLPEEKVERVRALEARHGAVAMVGDGVNDAPALAAATVGIAMGAAGSDAALETADVALMGDDLTKLAYLARLSHRGRGVIRQNVVAAVALKGLLAIGVPLGLVSLIVAVVVGDMGASLGVTTNALRLARLRP